MQVILQRDLGSDFYQQNHRQFHGLCVDANLSRYCQNRVRGVEILDLEEEELLTQLDRAISRASCHFAVR